MRMIRDDEVLQCKSMKSMSSQARNVMKASSEMSLQKCTKKVDVIFEAAQFHAKGVNGLFELHSNPQ